MGSRTLNSFPDLIESLSSLLPVKWYQSKAQERNPRISRGELESVAVEEGLCCGIVQTCTDIVQIGIGQREISRPDY